MKGKHEILSIISCIQVDEKREQGFVFGILIMRFYINTRHHYTLKNKINKNYGQEKKSVGYQCLMNFVAKRLTEILSDIHDPRIRTKDWSLINY